MRKTAKAQSHARNVDPAACAAAYLIPASLAIAEKAEMHGM